MKRIEAWVQTQQFTAIYPHSPENVGPPLRLDVTAHILALAARDIRDIQDGHYTSEFLVSGLLAHDGPRLVQVEESMKCYFGVEFIEEVTDEMLAEARKSHKENRAKAT